MNKLHSFRNNQDGYRAKIRQESIPTNQNIQDAHDNVEQVAVKIFDRIHAGDPSFTIEQRAQMYLIAAWFKGANLTRHSIYQGQYLQAAALIRQEVEIVSAITAQQKLSKDDIAKGKKAVRAENVHNNVPKLGPLHKQLSKIIHCNSEQLIAMFSNTENEKIQDPCVTPYYDSDTFPLLLSWRTMCYFNFIDVLCNAFAYKLDPDDLKLLDTVVKVLVQEGYTKVE